jgi:hypothetical protein
MANFELPFPLGGLNDNIAQSKQPSGTTGEAVNVRGQDPVTGRIRGAQRSGLFKYIAEPLESRVKRFEKLVFDNRQIQYLPYNSSTIEQVWDKANANSSTTTFAVVDRKENVYTIDSGRVIQKWNKEGKLIYSFTPPNLADENLYLRALAIDNDGNLWIGTGHQNPAKLVGNASPLATSLGRTKIYRYLEVVASQAPRLEYSFTPNLAIEKLIYLQGTLYAAGNDPYYENGYIVAYTDILETGMTELARRKVPYPLCDIDITDDGKIYFTAPQNNNRYTRDSLAFSAFQNSYVDWTPAEIPSDILWSWYEPSVFVDQTDDTVVTGWPDSSGAGRDLACGATETGPTYKKTAWAGNPCLSFNGSAQLYSRSDQPTNAVAASLSKCAIPNYEGAKWAIHIVFNPVLPAVAPGGRPLYVFGVQTNSTEKLDLNCSICKKPNLIPESYDAVNVNRVGIYASADVWPSWGKWDNNGSPTPELRKQGDEVAYVGAGPLRLPAQAPVSSSNDACVLTLIYTGRNTTLPCQFRLNGQPIDRWVGMRMFTPNAFYIGRYSNNADLQYPNILQTWFKGEIAEMVVTHNLPNNYTNDYPRTLGLACKTPESTLTVNFWSSFGATYTASNLNNPYRNDVNTFAVSLTAQSEVRFFGTTQTTNSGTYVNLPLQRGDVIESAVGQIVYPLYSGVMPFFEGFARHGVASSWDDGHFPSTIPAGQSWKVNPARLQSQPATWADKDNTTATLCEKIEGYLAWKWGLWGLLPRGTSQAPILTPDAVYSPGNWPHPFRFAPPARNSTATVSKYAALVSPRAIVGCFETFDGELKWTSEELSSEKGGIGLQVAADGNTVYTMGNAQVAGSAGDYPAWPNDVANARKLTYDPVALSLSNAWSTNPCSVSAHDFATDNQLAKLTTDVFGNAYYPFRDSSGYALGWTVYGKTDYATPVTLLSIDTGSTPVVQVAPEAISPSYRISNQVSSDFQLTPDPLVPAEFARSENVFVLKENTNDDTTVERYELVDTVYNISEPSPRAQELIAIANGKVNKITTAGVVAPAGPDTLPQPELDPASPYIDTAVMFGNIYMTDGVSYRVYNYLQDSVTEWVAADSGALPNRCKLLANWRGRAVLARGADDPHNWHMSEQGNPLNWDIFPPVQTATQAISGNNARAGLCPDLINSLIPYNDDLLLFGCDSSLWMMRGDPMAGGVFDLVSDVTGVAFGRSWAKDPEGTLYFFGSRGGVYMMKPGSIPVSMTQSTIERRLTEVNLSQFYVEMFWNTYDDGLHLLLMPFTDTATQTKHYFWERKAGAWYEDKFHVSKQPSAAIVVDGDAADDRCLLIGTYDANVVKWDKTATSDDGQIIDSKVVIGPVAPDDSEFDSRITNLAAVMAKQGAVNYKLYASSTPDDRGEPVASGQFVPGRNPIHLVRARGAFVWVELQQANAYTRWSLESMRLDAFPAGRKRNA